MDTLVAPPIPAPAAVNAPANESPDGLTSEEARRRLDQAGPTSMPDTSSHPARSAVEKLWAPIPWMLEAAIVLEIVLGKYVEGGIIAVLGDIAATVGVLLVERRAELALHVLR